MTTGGGGVVKSPELCSDMSTSTSRFSPLKPLGSPVFWVIRSHMRGVNIFPGSESPLPLPVYAWPSGSTFLLDPTVLQTVLASGTSSLPEAGTSAAAPPIDLGDGRLLETGLPGCPYRFSLGGPEACRFRMGIQRMACRSCTFIILGFWSSSEHRSRLDCSPTFWVDQLGKEQAMAAAINLQRDAGVMLSNLQILSQNVVLNDGLGHWTVVVCESRGRRLVAGAASSSGGIVYVSHGPVTPSDGSR